MYACLYRPPALEDGARSASLSGERPADRSAESLALQAYEPALSAPPPLTAIAHDFSPRFECDRDDLVSIDVSGLERLLGPPRVIGEELRRDAAARGLRVHVAVAATRMAAMVAVHARPGLTVIARGDEAGTLAPIPIGVLEKIGDGARTQSAQSSQSSQRHSEGITPASVVVSILKRWGIATLGELAALPAADLVARLGRQARVWQAIARGEDIRPLVPALGAERFDASLELEWPIEGLEPLSFVLTRLLEPLSTRLERRDRGAAVLHVILRLVTKETHACRLELPSPMRDVRTLRTLALLDLEAHPPDAAIDRVTVVIDPTPGRVLQHTLFTRAHPTAEQISTLLARLGALMGQDRLGAPVVVDSYRPGTFAMKPFRTEHDINREERRGRGEGGERRECGERREIENSASIMSSALRRCRQPVPARVTVADGRPVRVTTDRRGFVGGSVVACAGPWTTSGAWWEVRAAEAGRAGRAGEAGGPVQPVPPVQPWNRDEWDVALNDGAVYRIFQDRESEAWFVDAVVD